MRSSFPTWMLAVTLLAAAPAYAVNWGKAPLACFPDRAERWSKASEMEPCHCPPPQDGDTVPSVDMSRVTYTVLINDGFAGLLGSSTSTKTYTANELGLEEADIANPQKYLATIAEKAGGGLADFITGRDRTTAQIDGGLIFSVLITMGGGGIEQLAGGNFPMPPSLAARCYESVCPADRVPVVNNQVQQQLNAANQQVANNIQQHQQVIAERELQDQQRRERLQRQRQAQMRNGEFFMQERLIENELPIDDGGAGGGNNPPANAIPGVFNTVQNVTCQSPTQVSIMREGCIQEGTLVTLADGTTKAIEQLQLGDTLKSAKGKVTITALNRFTQRHDTMYGINGGEAFVSVEHPILTTTGWKAFDPKVTSVRSNMGTVGLLTIGDTIVTGKGTVKVESIEKRELSDKTTAYNLAVDGDGSFIANDVVVKSLKSVQIHY